jgi:hypothetical protein
VLFLPGNLIEAIEHDQVLPVASHKEQASMIRRYIIWRNNRTYDERLRRVVGRATVA